MSVPGPPPAGAAPGQPADPLSSNPLDEARARLDALDALPLHQHPEQFSAVDRLLRSALDGTDRVTR